MSMRAQNQPPQFRLRTLFILVVLVALPLGIFLAVRRAINEVLRDIVVRGTGPIEIRELWPKPLTELVEDCPIERTQQTLRVHCTNMTFDPEYVWRMEGDQELMDQLIQKSNLTQVTMPRSKIFTGQSSLSGLPVPDWWKPSQIKDIVYYVCPSTLEGEKGDRYQVAFSSQEGTIYVHYWFNF